MSVDVSKMVSPKSDQLNADDLIGGPLTFTITDVTGNDSAEQPLSVHLEGRPKTPFKPCLSMRRVLLKIWGDEGKDYIGRRFTLHRDDNVQYGGVKVGGIRISHASHIEREVRWPLTAKRGVRAEYVVRPLAAERTELNRDKPTGDFPGDRAPSDIKTQAPAASLEERAKAYERRMGEAPSTIKLKAYGAAAKTLLADLERSDPERAVDLNQIYDDRMMVLEDQERAGE